MNALFVLVRTDMDSMGRGRACAQVAHAANQFVYEHAFVNLTHKKKISKPVENWMHEAKGFGTTVVFDGGDEDRILDILENFQSKFMTTGLVVDPEYHLRDGDVVHVIPTVITCAYIFGDYDTIKAELKTMGINWLANDPVPPSV